MKLKRTLPFIYLIFIPFVFQSCASMLTGGFKKTLVLVDMPKDLKVRIDSTELTIKEGQAFGWTDYSMLYTAATIKVDMKKNLTLTLESKGKIAIVHIERKLALFPVLWESVNFATYAFIGMKFPAAVCGIATFVDFNTCGAYRPKQPYIDVPAMLNGEKGRDKKTLRKYLEKTHGLLKNK